MSNSSRHFGSLTSPQPQPFEKGASSLCTMCGSDPVLHQLSYKSIGVTFASATSTPTYRTLPTLPVRRSVHQGNAFAVPPNHSDTNLFLRHLPTSIDDAELKSMFERFGTIVSSAVMRDIHTGASMGTGFVRFETHDAALAALQQYHNRQISKNRRLVVQWARKQHDDAIMGEARSTVRKLFVRNIPKDVDVETLHTLMSRYGTVGQVTLHSDTASAIFSRSVSRSSTTSPFTATERCIAFVTYMEEGAAAKACEAIHNTCPFESCEGISLMAKLAEDNRQRSARRELASTHSYYSNSGSYNESYRDNDSATMVHTAMFGTTPGNSSVPFNDSGYSFKHGMETGMVSIAYSDSYIVPPVEATSQDVAAGNCYGYPQLDSFMQPPTLGCTKAMSSCMWAASSVTDDYDTPTSHLYSPCPCKEDQRKASSTALQGYSSHTCEDEMGMEGVCVRGDSPLISNLLPSPRALSHTGLLDAVARRPCADQSGVGLPCTLKSTGGNEKYGSNSASCFLPEGSADHAGHTIAADKRSLPARLLGETTEPSSGVEGELSLTPPFSRERSLSMKSMNEQSQLNQRQRFFSHQFTVTAAPDATSTPLVVHATSRRIRQRHSALPSTELFRLWGGTQPGNSECRSLPNTDRQVGQSQRGSVVTELSSCTAPCEKSQCSSFSHRKSIGQRYRFNPYSFATAREESL